MKKLMTILSVVFFMPLFSQNVGINTTGNPADSSAMLDVSATDKGVLIPRLSEVQRTGITSPAEGLLVYQSDGESGFYYYDGSEWVTFLDAKKGWSLDGNAGTDPLTDYVGTSDINSLSLGTNGFPNHVLFPDGTSSLSGGGFFAISNVTVLTAGTNDALRAGTTSSGPALVGQSTSTGSGVLGIAAGTGPAVFGTSQGAARAGNFSNTAANTTQTIFANQIAANSAATTAAIWGESSSTSGGVFLADFQDVATSGATGQYLGGGSFDAAGLFGFSNAVPDAFFDYGIGVLGEADWFGIYTLGDLGAFGTKAFCIDHPSEPDKKMLKHFSIESDEVLNVYRGNAQLNGNGSVEIELPKYFDSINRNFSYHLTPIGASMPNLFVSVEINENKFTVSGGVPNAKVSWMVQAERNDKYLQENPEKRETEIQKKPEMQGKYLDPDSWNQPERNGYFYKMRKQPLEKPDRLAPPVADPIQFDKDAENEKTRP